MEVLSGCGHAVHEDLPDKVGSEYMYHCIHVYTLIKFHDFKLVLKFYFQSCNTGPFL